MNLLKSPVVKATLERMVRGGIAAVFAAYVGGQLVLDVITVDTFKTAGVIFLSGAVASLLMCLGISAKTGTGPALNKAESIPRKHAAPPEAGFADVGLVLLIGCFIGIVLLLFRVHFGG